MFARVSLNTSATMLPLYLDYVTEYRPKPGRSFPIALAAVPLAAYLSSLLYSVFLQNRLTERFQNRLVPMSIAVAVTAFGSMQMAIIGPGSLRWMIYIAASIQGIGNAMMLNTATACISDVLGSDNKAAAFVYGCYSLADKFANGLLLYWLVASYSQDAEALKLIMAAVPTFSAVGCTVATWIGIKLYPKDFGGALEA